MTRKDEREALSKKLPHLNDHDLEILDLLIDELTLERVGKIEKGLDKILELLKAPPVKPPRDVASIRLSVEGADVQLKDTQQGHLDIDEFDKDGNRIEKEYGTVEWAQDDGGSFVTVTPSDDGFSAVAAAVTGATGSVAVTATVTVTQPSDGSIKVFQGNVGIAVFVPQPDVATIGITEGAIEDKPVV